MSGNCFIQNKATHDTRNNFVRMEDFSLAFFSENDLSKSDPSMGLEVICVSYRKIRNIQIKLSINYLLIAIRMK